MNLEFRSDNFRCYTESKSNSNEQNLAMPRTIDKLTNKFLVAKSCGLTLIVVLVFIGHVRCVIMPPRLLASDGGPIVTAPLKTEDDEPPYALTINEGEEINVKTNSNSCITINLNKAFPYDIYVQVKVMENLIKLKPPSGKSVLPYNRDKYSKLNASDIIVIHYPAYVFGDEIVEFDTTDRAGYAKIVCLVISQHQDIHIDDSRAFISVSISKSSTVSIIINIVGWIYFFAWSISFYFQVILNYKRKSVVGLSFNFLALNLYGFACYTVYNYTLMFSSQAQQDYRGRPEFAYSRIPVEYNDLFFSLHAFLITLVTVIQCFIYERESQRVSPAVSLGLFLISIAVFVVTILFFCGIAKLLDLVLYLSYVKLLITIIKYVPQAYMNFQRKATTGWSIHNIILDFTGGLFSLTQMFLLAYNYDDWISIFGNFTKFGLGIISIAFDILFVIQHYVLYREVGRLEVSTESIPGPVISRDITSTSYSAQNDSPNESSIPEID